MHNNKFNFKEKLKDINQLGALRFIHKGAHFTRYEYVLLQIALINFVKDNSEMGLGSSSLEIKGTDKKVTGADILQLIVLFSNIGHFKDTFSSNKVWFHLLLKNKFQLKNSFKKGLSQEGKKLLEVILTRADYQKIQWMNTLFILSRRKYFNDYRVICEKIVTKLLGIENENEILNKLFDISSKIRKVAYIVLDSHYSHIPVSISLQNVLFNKKLFIDELRKHNSGLIGTFERINELLEDTLYIENNALLMGTYRSLDIYTKINKYLENNSQKIAISKINDLIFNEVESPFYENFNIISDDIPWDLEKNLSLTFFVKDKTGFPIDVFEYEMKTKKLLGRNCFVATNFSPNFKKFRIVYSLNKNINNKELFKSCLKVICNAADQYMKYEKYSYSDVNNGPLMEVVIKKIITYFFRNILVEDYFCEYSYPNELSPFIIGNGSKKILYEINEYIVKFTEKFPKEKDIIHELYAIKRSIESISYKGLIIVYLGSLRFINKNKKAVCELDGVIFTPRNENIVLRVVEAKNIRKKNRFNVASEQLEKKFVPLLFKFVKDKTDMEEIDDYGAQLLFRWDNVIFKNKDDLE